MADLAYVLRTLPGQLDSNLLVGGDMADDAAVYRLTDELALVQTVDFFTPVVDDPYAFGQIAVANSLSDVYAMGGVPLTALNIVGFPMGTLPTSVLAEVLRGGADKAREAGVSIVGGHTIDDQEPKYGLAVTGTVHPTQFVSAHGANPSDVLVLTKPLGTGIIATAHKAGRASSGDVRQAITWMATLNSDASKSMLRVGVNAATDVTGFGFLGHLSEMCRASGLAAEVDARSIPLLPGALQYAREGYTPGGTSANLSALQNKLQWNIDEGDGWALSLADPQTSGGLVISLPDAHVKDFQEQVENDCLAVVIGQMVRGQPGSVSIH
ncbi:MAG: selenide, water dikinase SelD [Chloroflexota bacterium]